MASSGRRRDLYSHIEKLDRTVELLSVHIVADVMTFDNDGRITSMRAFWSAPEDR